VLDGIEAVLADGRRGERLREGVTIVVAGPPNAGKSTLVNALARRDVAIVSPEPGTTRDAIEVHLDLDGLPVTLVDTAGLREASGIEAIGVERARRHVARADLVLWLDPADAPDASTAPEGAVILQAKADLLAHGEAQAGLAISAATGEGLPALLCLLSERARELASSEGVLIARERQRAALSACAVELRRFGAVAGAPEELQAESLRLALRALGRLTGRVDVEEVLGEIFAGFCIGK
jgi:tRNA modification GTPase